MKKKNLASLAMIGIAAGALVVGCEKQTTLGALSPKSSGMEEMSTDMQSFYNSLSPEGQKKFEQLDAQHKMMAVEMTKQKKSGDNSCSAMGGCSTATNSGCAGINSCKGEGGAPIKDPNKAVDIQLKNQTEKKKPS